MKRKKILAMIGITVFSILVLITCTIGSSYIDLIQGKINDDLGNGEGDSEVIPVTSVSLNKNSISMRTGSVIQLTATIEPPNATDKSVTWTIDDDRIASVNENGIVTALEVGTTMVNVATGDGSFTDECVLTIDVAASEGIGFNVASNPGETGILTLLQSEQILTMTYAQEQASISFPTEIDDSGSSTLTTKFFIAETEVTNAVAAAVLQWAYFKGKFSSTDEAHNELSKSTVKYGNRELLDLDALNCRIDYDGSETFSVVNGYEDHPVTFISWYGAVMLCNWITEMRDGSTTNLVYSGITTNWSDGDTIADITQTGYRLPSSEEWEYSARFLGTTPPSTGDDIDTERKYGDDNPSWTNGYYWTPGNYASGATANYLDDPACQIVAVYDYTDPDPYDDEQEVKSLGAGSTNTLGLYDISGNVLEWCFPESGIGGRMSRGGGWKYFSDRLRIGYWDDDIPGGGFSYLGFRCARTK